MGFFTSVSKPKFTNLLYNFPGSLGKDFIKRVDKLW